MNRPAIVSLGEVLWDLFPDGARFGGAPANFAAHAALLGADVTMVSAVGDDARGREAIRILRSYGIRTDLIQILPDTPTGSVAVDLDGDGKPTFTIHGGSAWDRITPSAALEERTRGSAAVYFGTLGQRCDPSRSTIRQALDGAKAAGIPRILDVNLRPPFFDEKMIRASVDRATILKLSDDELADVCAAWGISTTDPPEECLARLLDQAGLDVAVMTRGAEGALLVSPGQTTAQPAAPTEVRDSVGAGDAFAAAFLIGLLRGDAHDAVLAQANELAAEACSRPVPAARETIAPQRK